MSLRENTVKLRETKFLQGSVIYLPEIICKFKSDLPDRLQEERNITISSIALSSKQRTIHLPRGDKIMPGQETTEEHVTVALLEKARHRTGNGNLTSPSQHAEQCPAQCCLWYHRC